MTKHINERGASRPSFKIATKVRKIEEAADAREAEIMKVHKEGGMDAAADYANKTRRTS